MSSSKAPGVASHGLKLGHFPTCILSSITKLLSSFSIGWLYFCGDSTLNAKFRSGGVRFFVHRPDRTGKRLWPALVSRLQLKTLCMAYASLPFEFPIEVGPTYFYLHETLDMLQPSLSTLKVSGDFRFETVDLVSKFPNLRFFALSKSWDIDSTPLFPSGLQKLVVTHPDYALSLQDLPRSLTYLEDTVLTVDYKGALPIGLKTLILGTRVLAGPKFVVPVLPPNLIRLVLGPTTELKLSRLSNPLPGSLRYFTLESMVNRKIFAFLPLGLLSLRIYGKGDEYELSDMDILRLPRNLTQLDVPHRASHEALCYLPRSLILYEGLVSEVTPTTSSMLPQGMRSLQAVFTGENSCLPEHLYELDCSTTKLSLLKIPAGVQRLTAWTASDTFDPVSFPRNLTSLVLVGKLWIDKNTFAMSSQLRHLSVVTTQEDVAICTPLINSFRDFPHRSTCLTRLVIVGGIFPDFLFSELPKTLESFSFTDGYFAISSPAQLRASSSLLTERCLTMLPPKLRHLQLRLSTKFNLLPLLEGQHLSLRSIDIISRPSDLSVDLTRLKASLPKLRFLAINSAEMEQDLYIYTATENLHLKLYLHVLLTAKHERKLPGHRMDPLSEL